MNNGGLLSVYPMMRDNAPEPTSSPEPDDRDAEHRDTALMLAVREGDTEAFRELVHSHQDRVFGMVARMLGNAGSDAEDVAQMVFVRVWQSAKRYQPTAKFTTYLYRITRNLTLNEIRRRKRHPSEPLDTEMGDHASELTDHSTPSPDALALQSELQSSLDRAIAALPEAQRTAVLLRRFEELPYEEIAVIMEQTVPAIKSLLFRARTELRQRLSEYLDA